MTTERTYTPFQVSDFAFVGYEALTEPLTERLGSIGLWHGPPAVTTVDDVVFVPTTKLPAVNRTAGRFTYEGGLIDRDGTAIAAAQTRRRGGRWGVRVMGDVPAGAPKIPVQALDDEAVIYLGWYHQPFGHFLLESLARTWYLRQAAPDVRVLFHPDRSPAPTGVIRRIFDAFDLTPERVIIPDQPTALPRVVIPEPLFQLSYAAHERMAEPYRDVAERIVGRQSESEQPVYLSRRLLPSHRRQIVGEFELEEILRENGFLIAYPETMSFKDQVRLFNAHRVFLTSAGSAIYGGLFALTGPEFHIMAAGVPRHDYFLMPKAIGATSTYINCFGDGGRPVINTSPLQLDLDRLLTHLVHRGLVPNRVRSDITQRNPGWRSRFDEGWLYAAVRDMPISEALDPALLAEALAFSAHSWPVTFALIQNNVLRRQGDEGERLGRQLATLLGAETSAARLAHYFDDMQIRWTGILDSLSKPTQELLVAAISERCGISVRGQLSRAERKLAVAQASIQPIAGLRYLTPASAGSAGA